MSRAFWMAPGSIFSSNQRRMRSGMPPPPPNSDLSLEMSSCIEVHTHLHRHANKVEEERGAAGGQAREWQRSGEEGGMEREALERGRRRTKAKEGRGNGEVRLCADWKREMGKRGSANGR